MAKGADREQWMRQMIDSITSAVQLGAFPEGLDRLKTLEGELRNAPEKSPLVAYIAYRRLLADYTSQQKAATTNAKQQDIQKWWRGELEKFSEDFPAAEDTPEAMLQLAIANEFTGQMPEAQKWYAKLAEQHPDTKPGRRAAGALRRLSLKGRPFQFVGPLLGGGKFDAANYGGKVLLVTYWSTWCTACTQDVPVLKSFYERYADRGFQIVGVNVDVTEGPIAEYLKENRISWPQVFEPGGTDSGPATAFGVIVPPLMILVDREGRVNTVTTMIDDIKTAVPELMGDKKAAKADSDRR
jgi:thiol-disulfide isomerase/thioredoxin